MRSTSSEWVESCRGRKFSLARAAADNGCMKTRWMVVASAALAVALAACSPALNWRSVAVPRRPCRSCCPASPTTRCAPLNWRAHRWHSLLSCDADGATFAVSYATLTDLRAPGWAGALACRHAGAHWRGGACRQRACFRRCCACADAALCARRRPGVAQAVRTTVQGQRPDGTAVTAHAAWFARALGRRGARVPTRWCLPTKRGLPWQTLFRRAGTALNPPTALAADLGGVQGVPCGDFPGGVRQPRAIMPSKPPTHEHQHPSHCPRPWPMRCASARCMCLPTVATP